MCQYCESAPNSGHILEPHGQSRTLGLPPDGSVDHPASTSDDHTDHTKIPTRRHKIWELDSDIHCAVIGTCAPVSELRRIYRKVNGSTEHENSDYRIHSLFVRCAAEPYHGIKLLQKYFDTRYHSTIRRYSQAKDEQALQALWNSSVDRGEVAAGYWALTTHPLITDRLNTLAFGEIHMLSHLAGRTWQYESSRRREAEFQLKEKQQKLWQAESALNQTRHDLDRQTAAVGRMKMKIIQQEKIISQLESKVQSLVKPREADPQAKTIAALKAKVWRLEQAGSVGHCDSQSRESAASARMSDTPQVLIQENRALESQLTRLLDLWRASECTNPPNDLPSLNGNCILYVGGRGRIRCQFRRLVELLNGKFLYHDGGREDNHHRLPSLVSRADIVLCPVTCVSHNAAKEVRRVCDHQTKPAVWLPAPSLSAFNAALANIAHSGSPDSPSHHSAQT